MSMTNFVDSLMAFNERVLSQGDIPSYTNKLTAADLKQILFFNGVFIGNTTEMFQKHNMYPYTDDYVDLLNRYIRNVSGVMCLISSIDKLTNITMVPDSFECHLETEKAVDGQLITEYLYDRHSIVSYRWDPKVIYYVTLVTKGTPALAVSYIDPRRAAYQSPIQHKFPKNKVIYKADYAIQEYVKNLLGVDNVIAMRVVTNTKTNTISLVEFHGDGELMKSMIPMFPPRVAVISNPFIYTGDLEQIIEDHIPRKEVVTKAEFKPIDFSDIFYRDRIIEFPNDSFDEYLQFLSIASRTPDTEAIYVTLYRIGSDPAIFYILRDAASKGVKVHVNIELAATGETINKMWLREMKAAGIHVTTYAYGKLKVHCKLTLIKFTNGNSVAQIGTGNYHTKTTSQYTDLCLITANSDICRQVEDVFKLFDGKESVDFRKDFLVTRYNAREELHYLIMNEAAKQENGYIALKCNALDDGQIIYDLEYAATAGCRIDAVIRGVCTWIPDHPANVRIKSIIWDKLEHSRVYSFGRTNPKIYMGSLDLVHSKLDKRIETLVQIKDPDIVVKVCDYLNRYITNSDESWVMNDSGIYVKEV